MKIGVIGSGITGNAAAWALHASNIDVHLHEQDERLGGHSHTVEVTFEDGHVQPVDTGFIVYNTLNYRNMTQLFAHLGVETIQSDMSFAFSMKNGAFEWCGADNLLKLFAQPKNILNIKFLKMLFEIIRFNKTMPLHIHNNAFEGLTLGQYLAQEKYSNYFINYYLVPMGGAIWSIPPLEMLQFPAKNFAIFFNNHRLTELKRPKWRTVKNGSKSYVEKLLAPLIAENRVILNSKIMRVKRVNNYVELIDSNGKIYIYDKAIMAGHSAQSLEILCDASTQEHDILAAIPYIPNQVYLHSDNALMPKRQHVWGAWNFLKNWGEDGTSIALTYDMNCLQKIDKKYPLYVSLNPPFAPAPLLTHKQYVYDHPKFTEVGFAAQKQLPTIQGANNLYFCGAWTRYGFHEDGLVSGLRAAIALGAKLPWEFIDFDAEYVY